MSRVNCAAVILRTKIYGESDIIVDLFTQSEGRVSVIARGALRSKKRYAGVLEIGSRVKVDYLPKLGLATLGPCDILSSVWKARSSLLRLAYLYHILEVVRLATPEGEADLWIFEELCTLLDLLESEEEPDFERFVQWDLQLLQHLGYGLRIDRCPYTGLPPDGLSLKAGGALSSASGRSLYSVNTSCLRILYKLNKGQLSTPIKVVDRRSVREALAGLWTELTGVSLRAFPFMLTALSTPRNYNDLTTDQIQEERL